MVIQHLLLFAISQTFGQRAQIQSSPNSKLDYWVVIFSFFLLMFEDICPLSLSLSVTCLTTETEYLNREAASQ
jgi:hypothetical protein